MKKYFIFFGIILCSCNHSKVKSVHYYDEYCYIKELIRKRSVICQINQINEKERVLTIESGDSLKFKEEFAEKFDNKLGVYRKFKGEYFLYYPIDTLKSTVKNIPGSGINFFFPNVIYSGKKEYCINNHCYTIYRYTEYYSDIGLRSYYLNDFGIIAYDMTSAGTYLLCTQTSGKENVSNRELKKIGQKLINDTSFFSMYEFIKPNWPKCSPSST